VGCLQAVVHTFVPVEALLNQGMNANFASDAKVSLALGFKNTRKEDSYLKSATPKSDIPHIFIYFYVFL